MTPEVIEAVGYCLAPECHAPFTVTLGRGRPRRFCSDECRRAADALRHRLVAQRDRLERQLRSVQHRLEVLV